jgi:membrane-associated phospholipid phosphatase
VRELDHRAAAKNGRPALACGSTAFLVPERKPERRTFDVERKLVGGPEGEATRHPTHILQGAASAPGQLARVRPVVAPHQPTQQPSRRRRVLVDIARIFSTVCNPFLTALVLFVILAHEKARSAPEFWFLLFVSTFFTSLGPMLYVLWLYASDRITDLDMSVRTERERVFGIFVIFYTVGTLTLWWLHAPVIITATMAGYATASAITQYITRYWKISTHALGVTAPLIVLIYMYGWQPVPFLVLIPIVAWSRVFLRAHTLAQVFAGIVLGGGCVLVFFRIFKLL